MQSLSIKADPRWFQIIFQSLFLIYGIFILKWEAGWLHYTISIFGCLAINYSTESIKHRKFLPLSGKNGFYIWGFSIFISAMSLCLLLKTNHWYISLLAAFLTVVSKYLFRINQKHIFNPSAFGIVVTVFLTGEAWLSPGQWGTGTVLMFAVITFGFIVVTRVQKLDVSLAFLLTYAGLLFWRQVIYLQWPLDFFIHSVSTGSLLLFTFFMISDPRTTPNHPAARIVWGMLIASAAFYLSAFQWKYNTPIWMLIVAAPLVPVIDRLFKGKTFQWTETNLQFRFILKIKSIVMRPFMKKTAALLMLVAMLSHEAWAFCGFYVARADGALKNKTSQVILVRDGNKTVITMSNDYKGDARDFALVVPVPVVLKKSDIKVVDAGIFQRLNDYSKPRLVEYYDQNPCAPYRKAEDAVAKSLQGAIPGIQLENKPSADSEEYKVKVEAQYTVGEYDIIILSAEESSGLKKWLDINGYKIPGGAEEVLDPYIKSNLKFFVVKVNLEEKDKIGTKQLRPIQIRFDSPKFMLPIRLGMANADGEQDMIVYAFTRNGRVEAINYRTVSLPTAKNVPLFIKENFGSFYTNLFQHQWNKEGRGVVFLEYAWDVSPSNYVKCDPCVSEPPNWNDMKEAGIWWMDKNKFDDYVNEFDPGHSNVFFTRLHVRYNRKSFPQDLVFQSTPNKDNYQVRYIVTHPAPGNFDCEKGKKYLKTLKERRQNEMEMLSYLTGKGYNDWDAAASTSAGEMPAEADYRAIAPADMAPVYKKAGTIIFAAISLAGIALLVIRKKK